MAIHVVSGGISARCLGVCSVAIGCAVGHGICINAGHCAISCGMSHRLRAHLVGHVQTAHAEVIIGDSGVDAWWMMLRATSVGMTSLIVKTWRRASGGAVSRGHVVLCHAVV